MMGTISYYTGPRYNSTQLYIQQFLPHNHNIYLYKWSEIKKESFFIIVILHTDLTDCHRVWLFPVHLGPEKGEYNIQSSLSSLRHFKCISLKNSHLKMADPAAAKIRKGSKSESWEDWENCRYDKTQDLCGVSQNLHCDKYVGLMSGRYAWYQVIGMVTAPCTVAGDGDCLYKFITYFEKEKFSENILWWWQNQNWF